MRIYHGWIIVVCSIVAYALVGGLTLSSFGVFVIPVAEELSLTRAQVNSSYALLNLGSALLAPFTGYLLDRYSARLILAVSAIFLGVGTAILALSHSIPLCIFALAFIIPAGVDGGVLLTMGFLIVRWFKVRRGRALAFSTIGMGLGGVTASPITAQFVANYGWRSTLLIFALVLPAILFAILAIIKERPGANDIEPGQASAPHPAHTAVDNTPPSSVMSLIRQRDFWLIAMSVGSATAQSSGVLVSLVSLGVGQGLGLVEASSIVSSFSIASTAAVLIIATFADKVDRRWALAGIFLLNVPVNLAFIHAHGHFMLMVLSAALGLAMGTMPALYHAIAADRFGPNSYGTVRGLMTPLHSLMVALAVWFAGASFDWTGGYALMFLTFAILMALATVMMLLTMKSRAELFRRPPSSG